MKIILPLLMILALGMFIFNLTQIDWDAPLFGNSSVALIGSMASASAFLLLFILMLSKKIAKKLKK
ncbi:hypothetical protein OAM55_00810 [Flavobacteriaceae bacterium]|jgi:hypothetical protein|nr:hypothetical protein [Flavobacteriaceae bacterium]MDA9843941.1 hypothetical protein [Flavobacteriaceae bacterium]MDA9879127.1 hypothetical protein [Flavobacteriaceae bacterium]MDC0386950.1 hypothetical protein [Flavobacteriaceae bacterium]